MLTVLFIILTLFSGCASRVGSDACLSINLENTRLKDQLSLVSKQRDMFQQRMIDRSVASEAVKHIKTEGALRQCIKQVELMQSENKQEIELTDSCLYLYRVAKIFDIYDGDTITVGVELGFDVQVTMKLRLFGIDTPELKGNERPEGIKSRQKLVELVSDAGDDLFMQSIKDRTGKYGRYLAILWDSKKIQSLNAYLVANGFAEQRDYARKGESELIFSNNPVYGL